MRRIEFPPIENATEDGLVAVGGDLEIDTLETAYSEGIFPWPISPEFPLAWFSPNPRGILRFDELHVPRSLQKFMKKSPFEIRFNSNFLEIIKKCASVTRMGQPNTWITPDIIAGYHNLFLNQKAWCVGAWRNGSLVGGLYGVKFGCFRSGESMFTLENNAGKECLIKAIDLFKTEQVSWIDTQMVTPVVKSLGGREIPRSEFIAMLKKVL